MERGNEVLPALTGRLGAWAADVVERCRSGGHGADPGDLRELVRGAERLALHLERC